MIHKPTFLNQNRPLITCMIQADNPNTAVKTVRNAMFDGCDAFGFQMEVMQKQFRTEDKIKSIFREMGQKPIYVTNYRNGRNTGDSDDTLIDGLLWLIKCGATLADIMADFYSPDPIQFTTDAVAVEKQKDAVKRVHDAGGEVLMSSHTLKFMNSDEVLRIATGHRDRGADISKIVTAANSEEEELENLRTTERLRRELDIPFLFLSIGSHVKLHRTIGPFLGSCMWLTVQSHDSYSTNAQPVCRAIRAIADNFDYMPSRY
jgi:3-dehydroquinate dehydratase